MTRTGIAFLILVGTSILSFAQEVQTKAINLYVGTTSGGGYDVYARVMARYWGRYLPGHPAFVVKNMPGAGGLTLANYIASQAPRDGSEITRFLPAVPMHVLMPKSLVGSAARCAQLM
jgi:tripartite-type tricarboxylate transporter receptor subunit TctC